MNGPSFVTREEFEALRRDIEARIRELTGEVDGEKAVTRHILEQTRRNGENLIAIRSELATVKAQIGNFGLHMIVFKADLAHQTRLYDVLAQDVRFIRAALERRETERREREEGDGK